MSEQSKYPPYTPRRINGFHPGDEILILLEECANFWRYVAARKLQEEEYGPDPNSERCTEAIEDAKKAVGEIPADWDEYERLYVTIRNDFEDSLANARNGSDTGFGLNARSSPGSNAGDESNAAEEGNLANGSNLNSNATNGTNGANIVDGVNTGGDGVNLGNGVNAGNGFNFGNGVSVEPGTNAASGVNAGDVANAGSRANSETRSDGGNGENVGSRANSDTGSNTIFESHTRVCTEIKWKYQDQWRDVRQWQQFEKLYRAGFVPRARSTEEVGDREIA